MKLCFFAVPGVGKLRAMKADEGPAIFAGIPYGAAPIGELRWAKPRPASPLQLDDGEYFDATKPRAACPQLCTLPSPEYVCPSPSEVKKTHRFEANSRENKNF